MASWKLCGLLLLCVLVALVAEAESRRERGNGRRGPGRRGNREENEAGNPEDEGGMEGEEDMVAGNGGRRRGGGRRGGGRREGRRRGGRRNRGPMAGGEDGEDGLDMGGPGGHHAGGHRRGGGRGRGGRRPGRGGRGPGGRGAGGRGRGGRGRPMAPAKMAMLMSGLSRSTGAFGLGMYREIAKTNPNNFVFSPISVHSAMSQLLLAAAGNTKRQLITGLNIRSPVHPAIKAYADSLDDDDDEEEQADLAIANKMYVKAGFQFNPKFNQRLQQFYNSSLEEFAAENPEDAVNQWVEEQTNGEIVDFLEDGDISGDTIIMLINAVYFKGNWADQFDAARTSLKPFQVNDVDSVEVETMQREGSYRFQQSSTLGASIIELPYEGDRYSFFIILPDVDTSLTDVENRLSADLLNETLSAEIYENTINLEVPKFSLDTEEALKESLQALGIQDAFDSQRAKLKKLTRARNTFVNDVQHRAVIEVDEQGTVAAAVTGVQIMRTSLPMPVKVDRPFMFIIRDKEYDLNLFMGRYTDPNGENLGM